MVYKQRQEFWVHFTDKNGVNHSYTVTAKNPFPAISYLRTRVMDQLDNWQVISYFDESYPFTDDCIYRVEKENVQYTMTDKQFIEHAKKEIKKTATIYQKEEIL